MKLPHSPTYLTSLKLYMTLANSPKGYTKSITIEQVAMSAWGSHDSAQETYRIRQELTIVEQGILRSLSASALKLAISIMDELCMNNALWWFEPNSPHHYTALKELRNRGIIIKTEDKCIHYVNPLMMRRGTPMSVVAQTTHILENMSRVNRELIRDLNYKSVKLSQMDQLSL